MKIIKWVGHPVIIIIVYLLLIIEGDNFGGFFILYLLLTLPHGVPFAITAAAGIACVIIAFNTNIKKYYLIKSLLYLVGFFLMQLALILFFEKGNKSATFRLTIPRFTFILFGICSVCFLMYIISLFVQHGLPKKRIRMIS